VFNVLNVSELVAGDPIEDMMFCLPLFKEVPISLKDEDEVTPVAPPSEIMMFLLVVINELNVEKALLLVAGDPIALAKFVFSVVILVLNVFSVSEPLAGVPIAFAMFDFSVVILVLNVFNVSELLA
jgi:hypothetical protein